MRTNHSASLYLAVVWFMGLIAMVSLVGIIALGVLGKDPPGALISVASGSISSLGTFLVGMGQPDERRPARQEQAPTILDHAGNPIARHNEVSDG